MSDNMEKNGNWFMRHKVITGILVVVIGLIAMSATGGDKSGTSTNTQSNSGQTQAESPKVAKIGEIAQSGDLAFTVTGVKDANTLGNSFTQKDAQGIFKVINLKIENTGKETRTIDGSMIKMTDDQGRTFERSIEGQTAKGMSQGKVDLFLQQVQPGLSVNGDIVFDVPADASNLTLMVQGGLLNKATGIKLE